MQPTMLILYVDNPLISADFYSNILHLQPVDSSPTFVLFILPSGIKFGLWSKHTVEPMASIAGGGSEVVFEQSTVEDVLSLYDDWKLRGLPILQEPTEMDFGFTFVAVDPDAHRLRVYVLK